MSCHSRVHAKHRRLFLCFSSLTPDFIIFYRAKLLYARKKGKNPSRAWLERVPSKAKMLENQLYKNAASLEAYLNRSTLKVRLGKLASAITSHYKEAKGSRRGSMRSSSSSISSLASLENSFADAKLRRESASSVQSLPSSLNSRINKNINSINMGENDKLNNSNGSNPGGALPYARSMRRQSDSVLDSRGSDTSPSSLSSLSGANNNNNNNSNHNMMMQKGNGTNFAGGNMGAGMSGGDGMNSGMQQQFLASIRQQQQDLARRMSGSGSNGSMLNASPASANPNMSMMGVGGNFSMLNQQAIMQQQQQQNAMTINLLQQQQNMLLQQQQQPMNQTGLSLHNISIMQQQQQRQMHHHQQQQQFPMMNMAGGQMNNDTMGINMMNSNLSVVIPGMNANHNPHMQVMMNNQMGMAGNNNGMPNMMDMMNMPPPGMAGAAGMSSQQRQSSTGNNLSNSDEQNCPLSPGSFNW